MSIIPVGDENVTFAPHGLDGLRLGGLSLDLASNAGDTDVDAAVEGFSVAAVGQIQEPIAGQHPVGVSRKSLEKSELQAGDRDFRTIRIEALGRCQIQHAAPEAADTGRGRAGGGRRALSRAGESAAQHALDASQQLARIERFAEIIIGAHLQPHAPVDDLARRGER